MSDKYPWRLNGCPYGTAVICPCIKLTRSFFDCPMSVRSHEELQERLKELRAEHERSDGWQ